MRVVVEGVVTLITGRDGAKCREKINTLSTKISGTKYDIRVCVPHMHHMFTNV